MRIFWSNLMCGCRYHVCGCRSQTSSETCTIFKLRIFISRFGMAPAPSRRHSRQNGRPVTSNIRPLKRYREIASQVPCFSRRRDVATFKWLTALFSPFYAKKNSFVTATKLGTTKFFFVAATKNFAAATKRFVDRTKHFVVVTKYFCYPYFNKWFCWYKKSFIPWSIKKTLLTLFFCRGKLFHNFILAYIYTTFHSCVPSLFSFSF